MCGKCQAEYNKYEELKNKLKEAQENTSAVKELGSSVQSDFNHVVIDGKSLDDDVISNCNNNFTILISKLQNAYQQCLTKMNAIESGCPGPDHYEPKK